MVYQDEVIHIADILPNVQALFYQVIQVIQHGQGHKLAYFAAQADAVAAAKTLHDFPHTFHGFPVFHALAHGSNGHIVRDAVKEVAHVAAQYPPVCMVGQGGIASGCPLFPVVSFQVAGQAV